VGRSLIFGEVSQHTFGGMPTLIFGGLTQVTFGGVPTLIFGEDTQLTFRGGTHANIRRAYPTKHLAGLPTNISADTMDRLLPKQILKKYKFH
jgi:hypothetical protein